MMKMPCESGASFVIAAHKAFTYTNLLKFLSIHQCQNLLWFDGSVFSAWRKYRAQKSLLKAF